MNIIKKTHTQTNKQTQGTRSEKYVLSQTYYYTDKPKHLKWNWYENLNKTNNNNNINKTQNKQCSTNKFLANLANNLDLKMMRMINSFCLCIKVFVNKI